jgi:glycosyltransferase involved in cell wall biosynthesis
LSNTPPLVSVICLCYNQVKYVTEAIKSVIDQSYNNIELIVIDDASTDNSKTVIRSLVKEYPSIQFLDLLENIGNCKAFNKGLAVSKGAFIIDLAADDILMPKRVEEGVRALQSAGSKYGVNFSDAEMITESGDRLYLHSDLFPHHTIPQGDIYRNLISKYFICPPTMMFTRAVTDHLGGYDENLLYEDFDFWIRSSREFLYCYTPEVLVKKRIVKSSLSSRQLIKFNPHLKSTFAVCKKIFHLNRTREEQLALNHRLVYEFQVCLRMFDFGTAMKYLALLLRNKFAH